MQQLISEEYGIRIAHVPQVHLHQSFQSRNQLLLICSTVSLLSSRCRCEVIGRCWSRVEAHGRMETQVEVVVILLLNVWLLKTHI